MSTFQKINFDVLFDVNVEVDNHNVGFGPFHVGFGVHLKWS